jgi:hypothetical protein
MTQKERDPHLIEAEAIIVEVIKGTPKIAEYGVLRDRLHAALDQLALVRA